MEKQKKYKNIFISHSSLDEKIVNSFIDDILIGALGFAITDIFSTSTEGAKIKSGNDWRTEIKDNILNAKVIFLIVTSNYKSSEMCLNEMGAAWTTSNEVITLIVDPINYKSVGLLQEINQVEKLNDAQSLDRIKDELQNIFSIPSEKLKSDRWSYKKEKFLDNIESCVESNPFPLPISIDVVEDLKKKNDELNSLYKKLTIEKNLLDKRYNDLTKEKGIEAVKKVNLKNKIVTEFQQFKDIILEVKDAFNKLDHATTTIVFNDYTHNSIEIELQIYSAEINKSIAKNYIDSELSVLWEKTPVMEKVNQELSKLSNFMKEISSEDFFEEYASSYKAPFDHKNYDFWQEVIALKI